jgi:hypothetical protein
MKYAVHLKKKHLAELKAQVPNLSEREIFELALVIGLNALTATGRGKAPKA